MSSEKYQENKHEIEEYMYDALWHFLDHGCGAAFFKFPEKLFEIVEKKSPKKVLEIGTGIGYSTFILSRACPNAEVITIEQEKEHCEIASQKLEIYKNIKIINAKAEDILQDFPSQNFDLIFYDGYAPRLFFLKEFERLLSKEGILISANSQKKGYLQRDGSTKEQYLQGLQDTKKWKFLEEFGDVVVYRKVS